MSAFGIGPRDVLALARHTQSTAAPTGPLLVRGVLAGQLARELAAGGDSSLVRTEGDPSAASAVVCVVAGAARPADEEALRIAARSLVPVVAVQTGASGTRIPYVLATDVVDCEPGKGFPLEAITRALAAALGRDGAALAGALPVLRDAVRDRRTRDGVIAAGVVAAGRGEARLPLLALGQARMLSDVAAADGATAATTSRGTAEAVAVPLAAALATGLAARTLVRRLRVRNRMSDVAVATAATYALAAAFRRLPRR